MPQHEVEVDALVRQAYDALYGRPSGASALRVEVDGAGRWVRVDPDPVIRVLVHLARFGRGADVIRSHEVGAPLDAEVRDCRYAEIAVHHAVRVDVSLVYPWLTERYDRGTAPGRHSAIQEIECQGGVLAVEITPHHGVQFRVAFPLTRAGQARPGPRPEVQPAQAPSPAPAVRPLAPEPVGEGSGVVILVDEEPLLRMAAEAALDDLGFDVIAAASSAEALRAVSGVQRPPVALFADVSLGGIDGYTLAKTLTVRFPGLRVALTSSGPPREALVRALQVDPFVLLPKPYTFVDVRAVLAGWGLLKQDVS